MKSLLITIFCFYSLVSIAGQPAFVSDSFIGKHIDEVAATYGRVMKVTQGCDVKMWASEFGVKKQECYSAHKKGVGGNTLRSYVVVDGVVKRESHRFQDTSYDSRGYDYFSSLEKISHNVKPSYVLENKQLRSSKIRNYFVSWELPRGYATANVECIPVFNGKDWIFPAQIRTCPVLQIQITDQSKTMGIKADIKKQDAEY